MKKPIPAETQTAELDTAEAGEPPSSGSALKLELTIDQGVELPIGQNRITLAIQAAGRHCGFTSGSIGVRVTNDDAIRELNKKHLGHDYATDVISFGYSADVPNLDGELVVSIDTASREAQAVGWPVANELLLYIVHGVLHITGMDDHDQSDRSEMRASEESIFLKLGIPEIIRCGADSDKEDQS